MSLAWWIVAGAGVPALLAAWRLLVGPAAQDRLLASQALLQAVTVAVAAASVAADGRDWLDIALLLQALGFGLGLMTLKVLRYRSLQPRLVGETTGVGSGGRDG